MKTLCAILAALSLVGCASNHDKSVLVKSTVLGLEVSAASASPSTPAFRLGLVRNAYIAVPTNATLSSRVQGSIGAAKQDATEELVFGANLIHVPAAKTNAPTGQTRATNSVSASLTNSVLVKPVQ